MGRCSIIAKETFQSNGNQWTRYRIYARHASSLGVTTPSSVAHISIQLSLVICLPTAFTPFSPVLRTGPKDPTFHVCALSRRSIYGYPDQRVDRASIAAFPHISIVFTTDSTWSRHYTQYRPQKHHENVALPAKALP